MNYPLRYSIGFHALVALAPLGSSAYASETNERGPAQILAAGYAIPVVTAGAAPESIPSEPVSPWVNNSDQAIKDTASLRVAPEALSDSRLSAQTLARLPAPLTDAAFRTPDPDRVALGRLLFHDPLLSGNRNIACATCHHATLASADGTSLGVGEGGQGLGPMRELAERETPIKHRVPRHSPALFNLGAHEFEILFHDGRVSLAADEPQGYDTPAEEFLPDDLPSVLAAQALFPLLSEVEMAGSVESNDVAAAAARRRDYGWDVIVERLRHADAWLPHFARAFPIVKEARDITIGQVGHALDDFINAEWRASASRFDRYLNGDARALSDQEVAGLTLFYGKAGCDQCHTGALQTDHEFHALMLPPFGPGRTRAFDASNRDPGRMNVTDDPDDAYRFRTPSLRNVRDTAPYGHNGAFATLEGIIRHHLAPRKSFAEWNREQLVLLDDPHFNATDFLIREDRLEMARYRSQLDIDPIDLPDTEVAQLLAFLETLTDKASLQGALGAPDAVPSGLPVD